MIMTRPSGILLQIIRMSAVVSAGRVAVILLRPPYTPKPSAHSLLFWTLILCSSRPNERRGLFPTFHPHREVRAELHPSETDSLLQKSRLNSIYLLWVSGFSHRARWATVMRNWDRTIVQVILCFFCCAGATSLL